MSSLHAKKKSLAGMTSSVIYKPLLTNRKKWCHFLRISRLYTSGIFLVALCEPAFPPLFSVSKHAANAQSAYYNTTLFIRPTIYASCVRIGTMARKKVYLSQVNQKVSQSKPAHAYGRIEISCDTFGLVLINEAVYVEINQAAVKTNTSIELNDLWKTSQDETERLDSSVGFYVCHQPGCLCQRGRCQDEPGIICRTQSEKRQAIPPFFVVERFSTCAEIWRWWCPPPDIQIFVCAEGGMQFSKRIRDGLDRRFFCIGPGVVVCAIKMVNVKNQGTLREKKLPTVCCVRLQMHKLRQNIG